MSSSMAYCLYHIFARSTGIQFYSRLTFFFAICTLNIFTVYGLGEGQRPPKAKDIHFNERNRVEPFLGKPYKNVVSLETGAHVYIDAQINDRRLLRSLTESQLKNNDTLYIFSHGRPGELLINGKWKGPEELGKFLESKIKDQKHLNIYGCEFAKGTKGLSAVGYLRNKLGITISASDDITGFGGDWLLEVGGRSELASMDVYKHNLQNYVDTGVGIHRQKIVWLQWNDPSLANGIHNGDSATFILPTGEVIQVSFTNVIFAPAIPSSGNYLPADMRPFWATPGNERAFHPHYDFSSTSDNGMLYSGAAGSGQNGQNISFDINFTASRNGVPYIPDLVFVDPESTNPAATFQENISATTNGGNWSLIENLQGTTYGLTGLGTATVNITDTESPQHAPLLLSKSSTKLSVAITFPHGNGHSGVSFGILAPYDHSDAPASYGDAAHLQFYNASAGPNMVNNSTIYLGAPIPDIEIIGNSPDAQGDDTNAGGDDEAAVLASGIGLQDQDWFIGKTYSLDIATTGSANLSAWIDWNRNGTFDATELIINNLFSTGGIINTSVTVPSNAVLGETYLRFRYTSDNAIPAIGPASNGEVEDYRIQLKVATVITNRKITYRVNPN